MKITISLTYNDLQKVLNESSTLRSLMGDDGGGMNALQEFHNRFLKNNKIRFLSHTHRVSFIKALREECRVNKYLFDQLKQEGHEFIRTDNGGINLTLLAAMKISDGFQ